MTKWEHWVDRVEREEEERGDTGDTHIPINPLARFTDLQLITELYRRMKVRARA